MSYLGIDCSTEAIHLAFLTDDGEVDYTESVSGGASKDRNERFYQMIQRFRMALSEVPGDTTATVEAPIHIQNALTTIGLAQVVGGVKLSLRDADIFFFEVDNKLWKKGVLGMGNASKEHIKKFAIKRWKIPKDWDQDFYDSVCIAYWGYMRFSGFIKE